MEVWVILRNGILLLILLQWKLLYLHKNNNNNNKTILFSMPTCTSKSALHRQQDVMQTLKLLQLILVDCNSSVGTATSYGMDGPGIESVPVGGRRCKMIRARPDQLWGPYSLLHHGYRVFHEV